MCMFCSIHNSCTRIDNLVSSFGLHFSSLQLYTVYASCYLLYYWGLIVEAYCIHMQQSYYSCYYMLLCIQILITTNRNMVVKLQQQHYHYQSWSFVYNYTCFIFLGLVFILTHSGILIKDENLLIYIDRFILSNFSKLNNVLQVKSINSIFNTYH